MENYSDIITLIIKLVITILSILISTIVPKIKLWVETKLTTSQLEKTKLIIKAFVQAAEQLMKNTDPTGELRKQYVADQLLKIGIVVDDEINALIESAVLELNETFNHAVK